jgi:hypothetical protein
MRPLASADVYMVDRAIERGVIDVPPHHLAAAATTTVVVTGFEKRPRTSAEKSMVAPFELLVARSEHDRGPIEPDSAT